MMQFTTHIPHGSRRTPLRQAFKLLKHTLGRSNQCIAVPTSREEKTTRLPRLTHTMHALSIALFLLFTSVGQAQVAGTGTIQGTVQDQSGALVPNANVTLTEMATAVRRTARTNHSGAYNFPNITIGNYSVSVSAPGFKTFIQAGNVLEVGSNIAVNVQLTAGGADQTVEVTATSLGLQTEDVSFKQTIDQTAVTELPLNGRQLTSLITLSGGAAPAPGGDMTGSKYSYAGIAISIAGGNGNTTTWRLDGGDNNDWMANTNLPFPFPDAVSQFSVESTALGAQDGFHSGGLVNVLTRSGTNSYHGSGFEFIRNNLVNATSFFSVTKDQLHQHEYGFTFGGPVRIPKLLNGHDKLFFFTGYQFQRKTDAAANNTVHLPTMANLAGDFSVTDPAPGTTSLCSTTTSQLYDPVTGIALPGNKYNQPGGPSLTASPYNSASLALVKYLPLSSISDGCGTVNYAIPNILFDKQFVTRVDYAISSKHNLYGRYFLDGYQSPAPYIPTNILVTTQSGNIERVQNFTIGENWTINSRTVNSFHATVSRRTNNRGFAAGVPNVSDLGITAANEFQAVRNGIWINVGSNSTHGFTAGGGTNLTAIFNDNAFSFADDVTMVRGKNQIVFGGEYVRNQLNISNGYQSDGNSSFSSFGQYSANGPTGTGCGTGGSKQCTVGDGNLDFLRGAMSSFAQSKQQQNALRAPIPSLYAQDTFHATRRLTLVAGIRWEPEYYPVDYFHRGIVFNSAAFAANQHSTVYPNAPAGIFYYGDAGVPPAFTKNSLLQFSPNAGVTFDPFGTGKTVLRAGFELAYDEVNFFTAQRNQQNPPFATLASVVPLASQPSNQLCFSQPWLIGGTSGAGCSQVGGYNSNPYPQPQVATKATATFPTGGQYYFQPAQFRPSNTAQWTASIQQDFSHGWQLQLDYIGNHTVHSPLSVPINNAVYIPGNFGANQTGCGSLVLTGPSGVSAANSAPGKPCSSSATQASRQALNIADPTQGYLFGTGGNTALIGDFLWANYNGLVTTLQHRLSSSFSLVANHTWSKCLNVYDAQGDYNGSSVSDPTNFARDYGPCGSDYRNVENVILITRSAFAFTNRFEKLALNNWEFAPLLHIQSGGPFSITQSGDPQGTGNGGDRANQIPGVPVYVNNPRLALSNGIKGFQYLNAAAFTQNPSVSGTFGNTGRNAFRGIPSYQFDAQVSRIFPIHDSLNLDLRLEAFNVLNHPNFSNASGGSPGTSSSFGYSQGASSPRIFQGAVKVSF